MSDLPESRRTAAVRRGAGPRYVVWGVLALVLLLMLAVAWVGVRGFMAKRDLEQSVQLITTFKSELTSGDNSAAQKTASKLVSRADSARSLTGDAVWGLFQHAPILGRNLRAVREVAVVVDDVASGAVKPVSGVLDDVQLSTFKPTNGKLDLEPLVHAQPPVDRAAKTLARANTDALRIDTDDTVPLVAKSVDRLRSTLTKVTAQADVANHVVQLAPAMLGHDTEQNYVLLFQNNAELRSGGGIPGAVALLQAADGSIHLSNQAAGSSFGPYHKSVLPLATDTQGLYGSITGEYMQDVTLTPRFDTSAKLAREMWKQKFGQQVDGVIAMDPVTLSYILKATGPVKLPTGDTLTSENAVKLLLSDVYVKYPDPAVQDVFFATAASAVFDKVSAGEFDPNTFVSALTSATRENRLRLWSADTAKERRLSGTAVSGDLPRSEKGSQRFGIYLNDATGAKMDYYLEKTVSVGSEVCRKDGRPTWVVEVTLKNTAPADAATTLPEYVTGGGYFGVTPGDVQTNVAIYAPSSGVYVSSAQDGQTGTPQTASDGKYPVTQFQTTLSPGESTILKVEFLGPRSASHSAVDAVSTPGVHTSVAKHVAVTCEDPLH